MTVHISLDAGALNALFPEGTEARVVLARSVSVALCEKLSIKETKHLAETQRDAVQKLVKDTLANIGIGSNWAGEVIIAERMKTAIKEETLRQTKGLIADAATQAVIDASADVALRADQAFQRRMDKLMEDKFNAAVKAAVRTILAGT